MFDFEQEQEMTKMAADSGCFVRLYLELQSYYHLLLSFDYTDIIIRENDTVLLVVPCFVTAPDRSS